MQTQADGTGISEPALEGTKDVRETAEWIWEASSKHKDYHKNMDGEGFEWWLENRLEPAFKKQYPGKKMILVMDNASYHHQLNTDFYPEAKTPTSASKGLNAHVLRTAGCTSIRIPRDGGVEMNYEVPAVEPADWTAHRTGVVGAKAPAAGEDGTVYAKAKKSGAGGPTAKELTAATYKWLKENRPEALDSKVEKKFRELGWEIVWTPPYCPKFQPIELVWGVGKQRAGTLYKAGRNLERTRRHLRRGWYGGKGKGTQRFAACNVRGCWETAEREMNAWIAKDKAHTEDQGVEGKLGELLGAERWTKTEASCLNIGDMEGATCLLEDIEADCEQDERAVVMVPEAEMDVQTAAAALGGQDNAE
jgi:hypothetical protein